MQGWTFAVFGLAIAFSVPKARPSNSPGWSPREGNERVRNPGIVPNKHRKPQRGGPNCDESFGVAIAGFTPRRRLPIDSISAFVSLGPARWAFIFRRGRHPGLRDIRGAHVASPWAILGLARWAFIFRLGRHPGLRGIRGAHVASPWAILGASRWDYWDGQCWLTMAMRASRR
jgi:hypothetical protein